MFLLRPGPCELMNGTGSFWFTHPGGAAVVTVKNALSAVSDEYVRGANGLTADQRWPPPALLESPLWSCDKGHTSKPNSHALSLLRVIGLVSANERWQELSVSFSDSDHLLHTEALTRYISPPPFEHPLQSIKFPLACIKQALRDSPATAVCKSTVPRAQCVNPPSCVTSKTHICLSSDSSSLLTDNNVSKASFSMSALAAIMVLCQAFRLKPARTDVTMSLAPTPAIQQLDIDANG